MCLKYLSGYKHLHHNLSWMEDIKQLTINCFNNINKTHGVISLHNNDGNTTIKFVISSHTTIINEKYRKQECD